MSQYVGKNVGNKVLCNNGTYDITNGIVAPCSSAGGVKQQSFDWSKIDTKLLGGDDFGIGKVPITSTPVLCKDGTTKIQQSSPNAEYMDACVNNGGRAEKQQNLLAGGNNTLTAEDKFYEMLGIKKTHSTGWGLQSRPMGRILVAGVLVAGYFAYKKFKK